MRIERRKSRPFLIAFLICLWGCEDNSASTANCLENASLCPRGSQCAVDTNGTPYCMPATPDGLPDATVVLVDDAMSTQGGTTDAGSDERADDGMGANSGGSENDIMGGTAGQGGGEGGTPGGMAGTPGNGSGSCGEFGILLKPSRAIEHTARVMLAVDRSGRLDDWNGWAATITGIERTLAQLGEGVQFGLTYFPGPNSQNQCAPAMVNEPVRYDSATEILDQLRALDPEGATPTHSAIQAAGEHLLQAPTSADYIMLITDGAPNCNPFQNRGEAYREVCICTTGASCLLFSDVDGLPNNNLCLDAERTTDLIAEYAALGVKTLVLGALVDAPESGSTCQRHANCPPSQKCSCDDPLGCPEGPPGQCEDVLLPTLSAFANAGDTDRVFEVNDVNGLGDAIVGAVASVQSCVYDLSDFGAFDGAIEVTIDDEIVANDTTRRNGWALDDGNLAFYGAACALIRDGRPHAISARCLPQ